MTVLLSPSFLFSFTTMLTRFSPVFSVSSPLQCEKDAAHIFSRDSKEDRELLRNSIVHCGDLANPVLPFELSEKWAHCVVEEFYQQVGLMRYTHVAVFQLIQAVNSNHEYVCAYLSAKRMVESMWRQNNPTTENEEPTHRTEMSFDCVMRFLGLPVPSIPVSVLPAAFCVPLLLLLFCFCPVSVACLSRPSYWSAHPHIHILSVRL